jgi:anti-sigma factor (TIGR02949 family)
MTRDKEHSHLEHDCLEAIDNLHAYLDGELDPAEVEKIENHLDHCRSCFSRKEFETAITTRIKTTKGQVPDTLKSRLAALIDKF